MTHRELGNWGQRIVHALGTQIVGEPVRAVARAGPEVGVVRASEGPMTAGLPYAVDFVSEHYAIEVKTVLEGGGEKIRPSGAALREKKAYAEASGLEGRSVLIVVNSPMRAARIYVKPGFGAYRSGGMHYLGAFDVSAY